MMNLMGYYRFLMQRSLALKIVIFVMLLSLPLSLIATIVCLSLSCSFSSYYRSCNYLIYSNPYECPADGQLLCCGTQGSLACQGYFNCLIKPEIQNEKACEAMVISSWVLYMLFIISTIAFFVLHRKLGP